MYLLLAGSTVTQEVYDKITNGVREYETKRVRRIVQDNIEGDRKRGVTNGKSMDVPSKANPHQGNPHQGNPHQGNIGPLVQQSAIKTPINININYHTLYNMVSIVRKVKQVLGPWKYYQSDLVYQQRKQVYEDMTLKYNN